MDQAQCTECDIGMSLTHKDGICRPKRRKVSCTSCGGLAVAMRLMKALGMARSVLGY